MSLNIQDLENPRELDSGAIVARCPACAEDGGDRKGEHLFVAKDGSFGCVCHQGEEGSAHRRRIFALVGNSKPRKGRSLPKYRYPSDVNLNAL